MADLFHRWHWTHSGVLEAMNTTMTCHSEHSNVTIEATEGKGIFLEVNDLDTQLRVDVSESQLEELRDYINYLLSIAARHKKDRYAGI